MLWMRFKDFFICKACFHVERYTQGCWMQKEQMLVYYTWGRVWRAFPSAIDVQNVIKISQSLFSLSLRDLIY